MTSGRETSDVATKQSGDNGIALASIPSLSSLRQGSSETLRQFFIQERPPPPPWTRRIKRNYLLLAVVRTTVYAFAVNILFYCDPTSGFLGGAITPCHIHDSLHSITAAAIWLGVVDFAIFAWFAGSVINVICAGETVSQSTVSNSVAAFATTLVHASQGVSMGAVGVWWGFLSLATFWLGPAAIVVLHGRASVTKKMVVNLLHRALHTCDLVAAFATVSMVGVSSATGKVLLVLAMCNLAFCQVHHFIDLDSDSLVRVCLECAKRLGLNVPMCVLNVVVLTHTEGTAQKAVLVTSILTCLVEIACARKTVATLVATSQKYAKLQDTMRDVEQVASALSRFDFAVASKHARDLPEELSVPFGAALEGFRCSQPYVPVSMMGQALKEDANPSATYSSTDTLRPFDQQKSTASVPRLEPVQSPESGQEMQLSASATEGTLSALPMSRRNIAALVVRYLPDAKKPTSMTRQALLDATTFFLSTVFVEARLHRGSLHSYSTGFEAIVTFGAANDSTPGNRATDAYRCAVALLKSLSHKTDAKVNVGLASGVSVCGEVGLTHMSTFAVIGEVIPAASEACNAAVSNGVPIVAPSQFRYLFRCLQSAQLEVPQGANADLFSLPRAPRRYSAEEEMCDDDVSTSDVSIDVLETE